MCSTSENYITHEPQQLLLRRRNEIKVLEYSDDIDPNREFSSNETQPLKFTSPTAARQQNEPIREIQILPAVSSETEPCHNN